MSTIITSSNANEVTILARLLSKGKDPLPADWARHLLAMKFSEDDQNRMNELAERNGLGSLSESERDELIGYAKAGCLLGILQSKARRALKMKVPRKPTKTKTTP